MLKKTRPTASGKARVTFLLDRHDHAHHVHLAGDFNGWQSATPMKKQKDGSWSATVELDPGREYEFRYLVDGNAWVNDDGADAYVANPFGADNSVVRVEAGAPRSGGRKAAGEGGGESTPAPSRARSRRASPSGPDRDMAEADGRRELETGARDGSSRGRAGSSKRRPEGGSRDS